MAITTSCCLSLPPPTSVSTLLLPSSTAKTTTAQLSWLNNEKWGRKCLVGIACMILAGPELENLAMAKEYSVVESNSQSQRWSDKRICPPWRVNSLETIVPENLPRPSARRKREATGNSENAPAPASAVKIIVLRGKNDCFTM